MHKPFRDDNPNPPQIFASVPPILRQKFLMKGGKSERLGVPGLVNTWMEDQPEP